ncbi:uncharacterized protein LOC109809007 [Cajanus cajan]|uniref:mTERF domain-containing protein 1, mitochondrial n=1 Tax=Cajanus cajan TaxID=3821 RepID=A0A151STG0_CAJCA|nr:uncharacterized protein LOC109809007 [Cajanus cajan]KYP58066.1 hypothetical protein KK1_004357 [Cajanus cajan]
MASFHTQKGVLHQLHCIAFRTLTLTRSPLHPSTKQAFKFSSSTSEPHAFTVSYLITQCGFSPSSAAATACKLRLETPSKPDSVISFLERHGFSQSQIRSIIKREHRILLCDPHKVLSPKFRFLRSKGASAEQLVHVVTTGPRLLSRSLHKHIVPAYEFFRAFLLSDAQIIACLVRNSCFFSDGRVPLNTKMLLDNGATRSTIAKLLRMWPSILCSCNLSDTILELKQMGFDSSTTTFSVALLAKRTVNKAKWGEKVEAFRKWGWSEEDVVSAFKRQPYCMLNSPEKIHAVFSFWVDTFGGDSKDLVRYPIIFQLSLQKRLLPRAAVLHFLASQGLRKKGASLVTPFLVTEKLFLERFVTRFQGHSLRLLEIYDETMNVDNT